MWTIEFNLLCKTSNKMEERLANEGAKEVIARSQHKWEEVEVGQLMVECDNLSELDMWVSNQT